MNVLYIYPDFRLVTRWKTKINTNKRTCGSFFLSLFVFVFVCDIKTPSKVIDMSTFPQLYARGNIRWSRHVFFLQLLCFFCFFLKGLCVNDCEGDTIGKKTQKKNLFILMCLVFHEAFPPYVSWPFPSNPQVVIDPHSSM